jgi:hypothetical protein
MSETEVNLYDANASIMLETGMNLYDANPSIMSETESSSESISHKQNQNLYQRNSSESIWHKCFN